MDPPGGIAYWGEAQTGRSQACLRDGTQTLQKDAMSLPPDSPTTMLNVQAGPFLPELSHSYAFVNALPATEYPHSNSVLVRLASETPVPRETGRLNGNGSLAIPTYAILVLAPIPAAAYGVTEG